MFSRLTTFYKELIIFGLKNARASVFGALLLCIIILTHVIDFSAYPIARYDIIFLFAILTQAYLILAKHESLQEIKVIFLFHIIATIMELFKTHPAIGAWRYPENNAVFMLMTVPLFAGFLYSSVGSYIARAWRIFHFHFTSFPPLWQLLLLSLAIYINFFSHHFIWDFRFILFFFAIMIFWKTRIDFTMVKTPRSMPLLLGFALTALFLYIAENIGTFAHVWIYPTQETTWHVVPYEKYGAWFLLVIISFTLVALIYRQQLYAHPTLLSAKQK